MKRRIKKHECKYNNDKVPERPRGSKNALKIYKYKL